MSYSDEAAVILLRSVWFTREHLSPEVRDNDGVEFDPAIDWAEIDAQAERLVPSRTEAFFLDLARHFTDASPVSPPFIADGAPWLDPHHRAVLFNALTVLFGIEGCCAGNLHELALYGTGFEDGTQAVVEDPASYFATGER